MIAVPIRSTETNEVIAALVLGFKPVEAVAHGDAAGMKSGILVGGKLQLPALERGGARNRSRSGSETRPRAAERRASESLRTTLDGVPHLLFFKRLNPALRLPAGLRSLRLSARPVARAAARNCAGKFWARAASCSSADFVVSHFFSRRLSHPVEKLAVVSEENCAQRQRAEAELQTHRGRTATLGALFRRRFAPAQEPDHGPARRARFAPHPRRFSAGSLRRNFLAHPSNLPAHRRGRGPSPALADGRGQAAAEPQHGRSHRTWSKNGSTIFTRMPEASDLQVETDLPEGLQIAGEAKYTRLVVQNLLDNARKYNRRGGTIRITARAAGRRGGTASGEHRPRHSVAGTAFYFRAFSSRRRRRRCARPRARAQSRARARAPARRGTCGSFGPMRNGRNLAPSFGPPFRPRNRRHRLMKRAFSLRLSSCSPLLAPPEGAGFSRPASTAP